MHQKIMQKTNIKFHKGEGHMILIYPKHSGFQEVLPPLKFSDNLFLWIVPFDLEEEKLIAGGWQKHINFSDELQPLAIAQ